MNIDRRDFDRLVAIAETLAWEVWTELYAAGPEEVAQHPTLRRKEREHTRATSTIERLKAKYRKG